MLLQQVDPVSHLPVTFRVVLAQGKQPIRHVVVQLDLPCHPTTITHTLWVPLLGAEGDLKRTRAPPGREPVGLKAHGSFLLPSD